MMTRQEIKKLIYEQQTKLAPSKISGAGVGVFAIVEIPKDTLIKGCKSFAEFIGKEDEYLYDWNEFEDLDDRIKTYLWGMTDGHDNKFYIDAPPLCFIKDITSTTQIPQTVFGTDELQTSILKLILNLVKN